MGEITHRELRPQATKSERLGLAANVALCRVSFVKIENRGAQLTQNTGSILEARVGRLRQSFGAPPAFGRPAIWFLPAAAKAKTGGGAGRI